MFLLAAVLFSVALVRAQISPGPLSRAHKALGGPTQCANCHRIGTGTAGFRCLDCHKEIARRLEQRRGLHAAFPQQPTERACSACHSEHNGEDFALIRWDSSPERFDHAKTGYNLEGKHAGLECAKCHAPQRIAQDERAFIQMKDLRRTFLGVSRDCLGCHQDVHHGQLGSDCQRCHTPESWKVVTHFDHARTRFPLTGKHVGVTCQKCHPATGPGGALQLTGVRFDTCTGCHADPHRGAFATSCQSCHTTVGWKQVALAGKFDHAKTDYPSLGKHLNVACSGCHRAADFKKPVVHAKCADCHQPDPHNGQFRARTDGGDCAACHTVDGFQPAKFGLREHAATQYPLEGKHAAVACAKCHLPAGKATLYKIKFALCTSCHADSHNSQFAGPPHFNRCEGCHTVQGYRPSSFTIARHQQTRFPLTGGHLAVSCGECHRTASPTHALQPVPYRFEERTCATCHSDPHRGQFQERMQKASASGGVPGCEACHSTKSWRDLARFDHSTTAFTLTGAHRAVPCAGCHRPPNLETTLRNVNFRTAPKDCQACHEDVHAGQFAREGRSPACAECHNTAKWRPSLFDHDKRTTFVLAGGHQNVKCSACHANLRVVEGKRVLYYRPTARECAACHAGK